MKYPHCRVQTKLLQATIFKWCHLSAYVELLGLKKSNEDLSLLSKILYKVSGFLMLSKISILIF